MSTGMAFIISSLTTSDIAAVLDISLECRLCLWSAESYASEIVRDDTIMLKLSDIEGKPAGFAVGRIFDLGPTGYTVELTNIGVREMYRGQGYGAALMRSFLARCIESGASQVILEVRESNSTAIAFYGRFGFDVTARRKGFYSDPFEDGLTMKLELDRLFDAKIRT
jgi:ribosomal-protein-alanine N-acetyltransferase